MDHSQIPYMVESVPRQIIDAQRLPANDFYPEYIFSIEFDNLLLEEVFRSKIHYTCTADQLQSFEILRDNVLGTKRLGLVEFSALHGTHLRHQDYPTTLHLQHRYVQLLQSFRHSREWTPKSPEIASLLLKRDNYLLILRQQVQQDAIEVTCYDPHKHQSEEKSETKSEAKSPLAISAVGARSRRATKLGRKPLKDKLFYMKRRKGPSETTPRKSLPQRKARKEVSYAEDVIVEMGFSQPEPVTQSSKPLPQHLPTRFADHISLGQRNSAEASSSNPFPLLLGDSEARKHSRRHFSPASQHHLSPNRLSGISKPSSQTLLARLKKDFSTGCRRELLRAPVDSSRFADSQPCGKTFFDTGHPVDVEGLIETDDVKLTSATHASQKTDHTTEVRNNELVNSLRDMEASLRALKRSVEIKLSSLEGRIDAFEQGVRMNMACMQSGVSSEMKIACSEIKEMQLITQKDIQNMFSGLGTLQSKILVEAENSQAKTRAASRPMTSIQDADPNDKISNGVESLTRAQKRAPPLDGTPPYQNDIKLPHHNAPRSGDDAVESEQLNGGYNGGCSNVRDLSANPISKVTRSEGQPFRLLTFLPIPKQLRRQFFPKYK